MFVLIVALHWHIILNGIKKIKKIMIFKFLSL